MLARLEPKPECNVEFGSWMLVKKPPRRRSAKTEVNVINASSRPRMEGQPNGARNVTRVPSINDRMESPFTWARGKCLVRKPDFIGRSALPVGVSCFRVRRGLDTDLRTVVCHNVEETSLHLLRDCIFARNIWEKIVEGVLKTNFVSTNLNDWMSINVGSGMSHGAIKWSTIFTVTIWRVWRWRNALVFNDDGWVPLDHLLSFKEGVIKCIRPFLILLILIAKLVISK
ncbi:hypothetical protein Cgig2_015730 [Carnegiea gigantea]|uniref:Reverse transcriptase zinc-binding domain-containing protein n=1 Tax=Carnegiea gigantea TaxID=171969 RepID=A0A9Q1JHU3_9CARY|nr:hypothetical protein Cgig2_015730 [Carnegiea gigantea]